ncbi:hypothetical protein [Phytohabitans houttuyneae]|nr:hypothetical protein [Phytohabitans houttuyneae]
MQILAGFAGVDQSATPSSLRKSATASIVLAVVAGRAVSWVTR